MPDQLCNKSWAKTNDPAWGVVVVTGQNKYAKKYTDDTSDFEASSRIGFHSCVCAIALSDTLPLHCALLSRGPKGASAQDYPMCTMELHMYLLFESAICMSLYIW